MADLLASLPHKTLVPFLRSFTSDCAKRLGESNFGGLYCPCAAAAIEDRFTMVEATDSKVTNGGEGIDKAHPGTQGMLKFCALVPRPADGK